MRPMMRPMTQIVAVAENGVIGRDQALPWHLPSDLKRFKALTMGKPMLMGRHTFISIGRPLPGRISVVVSSDPAFAPPEGVRGGRTLEAACALADAAAQEASQHGYEMMTDRIEGSDEQTWGAPVPPSDASRDEAADAQTEVPVPA